MCGIAGALSAKEVDPAVVCAMRDSLEHRGPDHAGLWTSPDRTVCLGHRRLAIIDLSPDANQPFVSHDGRYVITFNGEIYNFREVRDELAAKGTRFRTQSDTEVLLEAFRCWGEAFLPKVAGMFAFAIWDSVDRRLFCARDRAGEKPFYYAATGQNFIFGSELKALLAWPGFSRTIHYPALIDYLWLGFVPDPKSIWEGCLKLPPGSSMWVDLPPGAAPRVHDPVAWWDWEFDPDESSVDWGSLIRDTLSSAASQMSYADVPVGTFLSGGVDSSSVTAALSRQGRAVKTFTVGFPESSHDERPFAATVADLYKTEHTEKLVAPGDTAPVFDKLLWHYDEPFNDYSYVPTFYVCREARQSITVALSGDGADEVFGGYTKYRRLALRGQCERVVPEPLMRVLAGGLSLAVPKTHGAQKKLAVYRKDSASVLLDTLNTALPVDAIRPAARGRLASELKNFDPMDTLRPLLRKASPKKIGLLNAMRYLDLKLTLAGDMLVKVDRASMAVALEVRPVYLHRDVMALAARIPAGLIADRKVSKKLLKTSLRPWLPESILYRRKMGFSMPLETWAKGDLGQLFSLADESSEVSEWLDVPKLEKLSQATASDRAGLLRHSLFFLKRWMAEWGPGRAAAAAPVYTSGPAGRR